MTNENELKVSDVFNHPLDEDFKDPHSIISHLEYSATVCGSGNPERTNLVDDVAKEAIAYIKLQRAEIERLSNLINQSNQELIENCTCAFRDDVVAGVVRRCALCPIQYSIKPEDK